MTDYWYVSQSASWMTVTPTIRESPLLRIWVGDRLVWKRDRHGLPWKSRQWWQTREGGTDD